MELTDFDKTIMRLHWVAMRMQILHNEFFKIDTTTEDGKWLQAIFREYIIVQLQNFIKIRKTLCTIGNLKEVDECLRPLWEPILVHEKAIQELRNSYFAHMQEKKSFDKYIEDIILEHQFPNTFGDVLFFAGCVYLYYDALTQLLKKQFEKSVTKYKVFRPVMTQYGKITPNNVSKELIRVKSQAEKNVEEFLQQLKSKN